MSNYSPLILFLYNRPYQTINTINYLKQNPIHKNTDIIIFSDGYKKGNFLDKKKVEAVRFIINNIKGFKSKKIFFRKKNLGLFKNIISGIDFVFKKYDRAIILEDDIIVNNYFLENMNKALNLYKNNKEVSSIHAWFCEHKTKLKNTFFLNGADIWGWATWKDRWLNFERNPKKILDILKSRPKLIDKLNSSNGYDYLNLLKKVALKKSDSWGVLWIASNIIQNKLYLNFSNSLCINIGQDHSGTNSSLNYAYFNQKLRNKKILIKKQDIVEDKLGKKVKNNFFIDNFKLNFPKKFFLSISNKIKKRFLLLNQKIKFKGPFKNWEEALNNSDGYDDKNIIKKVLESSLLAKNNLYFFERDGYVLNKNSISSNKLFEIIEISRKKNKPLNIVDFGGSLGSEYFKIKDIINLKHKNNWYIIEQKNFVEKGKKFFKDKNLKFLNNIKDLKNKKIDLLILSGSIHYLDNPKNVFQNLVKLKPKYLFVDRTPINQKIKNHSIFVQKKGNSSYPFWMFSEKKLYEMFKKNNYRVKECISSEFDHNLVIKNFKIQYKGYILKSI